MLLLVQSEWLFQILKENVIAKPVYIYFPALILPSQDVFLVLFLANETNSTPVKPVPVAVGTPPRTPTANGEMDEETLMKNREKFLQRGKKSKTPQAKKT